MEPNKEFFDFINNGYKTKGDFITLGAAMLGEETVTNALVKYPFKDNQSSRINCWSNRNWKDKNITGFG